LLGADLRLANEREVHMSVPLAWLANAARLPGKSLHVAVTLWCISGLTRSQRVELTNVSGRHFGLDRCSKYRGLTCLEEAGLVTVKRKLGRAPMVTILDPEAEP
jgi:hypothetical protein